MDEEKSETIQDDVEQTVEDKQTVEEAQKSERESVMDEIVRKRKEQREEPEEAREEEPEELEESTEQETTTEEPTEELVRIIVDGVEKDVPKSKVLEHGIRTMQKESTADARLRLAAQRRAELQDMERRIQLKQQQEPQKAPDVDVEAFGKEFNEALYDDDGKAGGMIAKVLEDQQQIREIVTQSNQRVTLAEQRAANAEKVLRQQVVRERKELSDTFAEKFEKIDKDPSLRNMANDRTVELMSLHPEWSDKAIIMQAGEDVQAWLHGVSGVPTSTDSRIEKKRNMMKQPRSVGARSPSKPEAKRKTRADVFREMKAARGQPIE